MYIFNGIATHLLTSRNGTPRTACGLFSCHYSDVDLRKTDCLNCIKTNLYKNKTKEQHENKTDND